MFNRQGSVIIFFFPSFEKGWDGRFGIDLPKSCMNQAVASFKGII